MRPASHMPLAEMMMAPPVTWLRALLSSTDWTRRMFGWRNSSASSTSTSFSSAACLMKTSVTFRARGESR